MLRRKAGVAVAAAARVVRVAAAVAVAVQAGAAAVQAVPVAPQVAVAVVRVQVAVVAAATRVAAAVRVEAVTAAAAVEVQVAGMLRAAAVVEVRAAATEASRIAVRETAVAPKVAHVIVRVITTRRLLLVTATVIEKAIGTETATWFVIETGIETETVIERKIVIETETVIEAGRETLPAVFANAIASVTKTGGENVSVAAPSIPRVCICRRTMAAMDTAQTRMSRAIRTACTRARTMRAGARVTIRAAHTFTSMAPAGFYPSSAVRLRTAKAIAMVFCADMKRGTSATTCISPADAFIGSAV